MGPTFDSTKIEHAIINHGISEKHWNELAQDFGLEWHDRDGGKDLDANEIKIVGEEWKKKYLQNGSYTNLFYRRLREVANRQWNNIAIYHVLDRGADGDPDNNIPTWSCKPKDAACEFRLNEMYKPRDRMDYVKFTGGDLQGFIDTTLDYYTQMGINMIWVSPIVEQAKGPSVGGGGGGPYTGDWQKWAYHYYWGIRFDRLDPHLTNHGSWDVTIADNELVKKMITEAHRRGIKIMLDVPINHTGPVDGADNGKFWLGGEWVYFDQDFSGTVQYEKWGQIFHHSDRLCYWEPHDLPEGYLQEHGLKNHKEYLEWGTLENLGDLNLDNPKVREWVFACYEDWMRLGFDGARYDAMPHVSANQLQELDMRLRRVNPDMISVGETWDGGMANYRDTFATLENSASQMTVFDFQGKNIYRSAFGSFNAGLAIKDGTCSDAGTDCLTQLRRGNVPDGLGNLIDAYVQAPQLGRKMGTFLDNHDFETFQDAIYRPEDDPRHAEWQLFRKHLQNEALKFMTAVTPGDVYLYYPEVWYHYDEKRRSGFPCGFAGGDPWNRPLADYNEDHEGFRFMQRLAHFRRGNFALSEFGKINHLVNGKLYQAVLRSTTTNEVLFLHARRDQMDKYLDMVQLQNWPTGIYEDNFTGIKYKVNSSGRISMIDGQYVDPVFKHTWVVKDGRLQPLPYIKEEEDNNNLLPDTVLEGENGQVYQIEIGGENKSLIQDGQLVVLDGLYTYTDGMIYEVVQRNVFKLETKAGKIGKVKVIEGKLPDGNCKNAYGMDYVIRSGEAYLPYGRYVAPNGTVFIVSEAGVYYELPYRTTALSLDRLDDGK